MKYLVEKISHVPTHNVPPLHPSSHIIMCPPSPLEVQGNNLCIMSLYTVSEKQPRLRRTSHDCKPDVSRGVEVNVEEKILTKRDKNIYIYTILLIIITITITTFTTVYIPIRRTL